MDWPTHEEGKCGKRGERWECLHAIDADHFWLGDLMVDLVQLRYESESLNARETNNWSWDIHERNRIVGNLNRVGTALVKDRLAESWPGWVRDNLRTASKHGLHTGYSE